MASEHLEYNGKVALTTFMVLCMIFGAHRQLPFGFMVQKRARSFHNMQNISFSVQWKKWNHMCLVWYEEEEMKMGFTSFQLFWLTGKEISSARAGGQNEGEGEDGGGEVQTFSAPCWREEPRPHLQMGGEISRVHRKLPGAVRSR